MGQPAQIHERIGDVLIRNVTTDIRRYYGDDAGGEMVKDGNSIFIFEVAGLCIGHLGHLHHKLDESHFAAIGRLDIVMVPIDGSYTMSSTAYPRSPSGCAPRWCCPCIAS